MQDHAHEEKWDELREVVLDVRTAAGAFGAEGEKHAVAMSYFHLVQRLEFYYFNGVSVKPGI